MIKQIVIIALIILATALPACTKIDDNHTPAYQVNIRLNSAAMWNTYGVHSIGEYKIFSVRKKLPSNFHFTANTYTGFAGVMLLQGFDFTTQTGALGYGADYHPSKAQNVKMSNELIPFIRKITGWK